MKRKSSTWPQVIKDDGWRETTSRVEGFWPSYVKIFRGVRYVISKPAGVVDWVLKVNGAKVAQSDLDDLLQRADILIKG